MTNIEDGADIVARSGPDSRVRLPRPAAPKPRDRARSSDLLHPRPGAVYRWYARRVEGNRHSRARWDLGPSAEWRERWRERQTSCTREAIRSPTHEQTPYSGGWSGRFGGRRPCWG